MSPERRAPHARKTILVVDDEQSMRELLALVLGNEGYRVLQAGSGREARDAFAVRQDEIDIVIQDLKMPDSSGEEILRWMKDRRPALPVIVITAFSTWDSAVEAMRMGAFDYIRKPFDTDAIRSAVKRALERLEACAAGGSDEAGTKARPEMIGNNRLIQALLRLIELVAPTDSTVFIQGESGTGKEIVARHIHQKSHRRDGPFVAVNCSAFTESLLESELFGHIRGAFTGAFENKQGLFSAANGGTLFLDEVADMSLTTQVKILRVLEERKLSPVGSTELQKVDVRIIAATNKTMEEEIAGKRFRDDLYYRLNVIPLFLPPLRDRKEDIPLLAGHFLARYSRLMGKTVTRISESARTALLEYPWPGNVRELENIIQRHVALCSGDTIDEIALRVGGAGPVLEAAPPPRVGALPPEGMRLEEELERIERKYLAEALERTGGNLTKAAQLLGMTYRSIRYRVKKLHVREFD